MTLAIVTLAVLLVAYANGANDNFKGVATLFGSGTTRYRTALAWGTACTFAGSVAALLLSEKLLKTFSGSGLVPPGLAATSSFLSAVAIAAGATVLLATRLSFPISTTHALTGALVGAGLVMSGDVRFSVLGAKFVLPLLLSPLLAGVVALAVYPAFQRIRIWLGVTHQSCVCVDGQWVPSSALRASADGGMASSLHIAAAPSISTCEQRYQGALLAVDAHQALGAAHFVSAGALSFARGLNDTPKIAALVLAAKALPPAAGLALVGGTMAAGAILSARRVAETMSKGITTMNHGQSFSANVASAVLVIGASALGAPVSTTHVSCGALFGIGAVTGGARWKTISSIALAWVITLPVSAVLAGAAALLTKHLT